MSAPPNAELIDRLAVQLQLNTAQTKWLASEFQAAQLQLVTELLSHKVEVEDAYGSMVAVVEAELLEHKKQELERGK